MSFSIKFTPQAQETYDAVVSQLNQRWGEDFVIKFENKVSKSISSILLSPYMYPVADENTGMRKCVLHKNCSMFYNIYNNNILIAWFWDNRQEPIF
jgi:plasmid stabilization system protein ParE